MLLGVLALAPAPARAASPTIKFKTKDGWNIAAVYRPGRKDRDVAILIHGVASGKDEWGKFAARLEEMGMGSLALDLRGHGQSQEGPRGHEDFTGFDAAGSWPLAVHDIEAAVSYLRRSRVPASRIGLAGASIGANLASQTAARQKLAWLILFSPGMNYRGVGVAVPLRTGKVLLAASRQDSYAYQSVMALKPTLQNSLSLEAASGHGAQMFTDEAFLTQVLAWLRP